MPNSDWITFPCGSNTETEIYLAKPDGSDLKQVTHTNLLSEAPTWSPDGQWILFTAKQSSYNNLALNSNAEIYRIRPDGTDLQQLTTDDFDYEYPSWSPDGQSIIFAANREGLNKWNIYRMKFDGSQIQKLTSLGNALGRASWSSNSQWITFNSDSSSIYRMRPDGSDLVLLFAGNFAIDPIWSLDGKQIIFTYSSDAYGGNIFQISWNGGTLQRITNLPGLNRSPSPSPDGKLIIFNSNTQIYKVKPDGGDLQKIVTMNCAAGSPSWFSFQKPFDKE